MKGVGSYNDWTYYASPSSNLSAFAAPFSVNRSNSNDVLGTVVDSAAESVDAVQFPVVPSRSYGYDFFSNSLRELDSSSSSSSKPYGYSGVHVDSSSTQLPHFNSLGLGSGSGSNDAFSYDQCPDNSAKPSFVEAQPYYPAYIASPSHDPTPPVALNHWSSSSGFASLDGCDYAKISPEEGFTGQRAGLWNQFADFNHGKSKQVGVGSSFSSKQTVGSVVEERMDQRCQDVKDSKNGEASHMIGWEKYSVPVSADQLVDKSYWWETVKAMPAEFSTTSVMGSPSVYLETHHEAPLKSVDDSGNHHLSYTGSYDKHLRQHDKSRVDTISSTPIAGLVKDLNTGNIIADGDLGSNSLYNIKEAYHMPSPGTAGCFDLGRLRIHLERNEPTSSNNAAISGKNVSRDVVNYIFKERHGFQNPHESLDNLGLRLSANEGLNSVEKSFDSADRCNPAVDSPCWKGAPAAHFSHYEVSEALPPEYVHKNEECFGSVIQEPQNFVLDTDNNVNELFENSSNYQMRNEIVHQETSLAGCPRTFSMRKFASRECNSDGAVNAGPFQGEKNSDCGLQYLDDITELKENSVAPTKPLHDRESGSSNSEHQVIEANKLMFQKQHTLCIGGADTGINVNKSLEYGTSHTAEHAMSLPSSVVDPPTKLEKSTGNVSTQKLNVQMLVDTMHNLSELLLFHCLNNACELKEQDRNVLKNVISNLNTCASKNAEQITPVQECLFPQSETSSCAEESCELHQNASFVRPQLTKVGPESTKVELENPLIQEAKNLHFSSGKPHWKLSDSISPRGDAEITKEDDMTKALKRILSENFHDDEGAESQTVLYKNLWLEAEAALCSVYYRARYNQMKIEMEKYKQRDMEEQSKPEFVPSLSRSQSSATKVQINPNPYSSASDLPVANAINLKELSGLKFSTDLNNPNELTPEGKGSRDLDSVIQNSTVSGTNKEAGDDEASVMARFHVLRACDYKPCINIANLEESGLKFSTDLNKPHELTPEGKGSGDLDSFIKNSIVSGTNKEARDYEASFMARFHVLKARDGKSCINTANLEEQSDIADKILPRGRDNQSQVNFSQDSPISGNNKAEYEASVMARFHILKSRAEDSSSISSEGKLLDGVGFSGKGIDDTIITKYASEDRSLDVRVNPATMHLSSYTAVDKSIPKEFHLDLEDNEEIQPCGTHEFGNQLPSYYSDGLASDWEHVEKRSL